MLICENESVLLTRELEGAGTVLINLIFSGNGRTFRMLMYKLKVKDLVDDGDGQFRASHDLYTKGFKLPFCVFSLFFV